jgi:hypothetical protein
MGDKPTERVDNSIELIPLETDECKTGPSAALRRRTMNTLRSNHTYLFVLLAATLFCFLSVPQTFGQSEKLGAVGFTSPKGFTKTLKENVVAFSSYDQSTGKFCIITLYGVTPGTGSPQGDFNREWNNLVVKTLNAETNPKTESEVEDGWTATGAGTNVDFNGGKALAILTVMTNGDRTASILAVFNEPSYAAPLAAFNSSIQFDKSMAAATPASAAPASAAPQLQNGKLVIPMPTRQLTIADIAGEWGETAGLNTRYVDRYTGTYAGFESLHFRNKMTFTASGGYANDFFAISNGRKISEDTFGRVAIVGRVLSITQKSTAKYVIRGWLELPDMTVLTVCGPWYDDDKIPEAIFSNPDQGANLDKNWIRKR